MILVRRVAVLCLLLLLPSMEYPLSPFVIDTGSGSSKCGVAGDDAPKACFPSIVGHLRNSAPGSVISSMSTKDSFVGSDAQSRRGILAIQNPIEVASSRNFNLYFFFYTAFFHIAWFDCSLG